MWPPVIGLIGFTVGFSDESPLLIDISQIDTASDCKKKFQRSEELVSDLLRRAVWPDGTPVKQAD